MTGALILILVIAALWGLRMVIGMFSRGVERGIYHAGGALGRTLADKAAAKRDAAPRWVVTPTRPGAQIRTELRTQGLLRDGNRVETPAGVSVELSLVPGVEGLVCDWNPFEGEKGTQVIADVLRIVRQVDPGAQVIL